MTLSDQIKRHEKRLIFVSNIETYTVESAFKKMALMVRIGKVIYDLERTKGKGGISINWFGSNFMLPNSCNLFEEGKRIALMGKQLSEL